MKELKKIHLKINKHVKIICLYLCLTLTFFLPLSSAPIRPHTYTRTHF